MSSEPGEDPSRQPREEDQVDARADGPAPTVVIVSGLSGSGKSVALKTFEDLD